LQANQLTNVIAKQMALLDHSGSALCHLSPQSGIFFDDGTGREGISVIVDTLEHVLSTVHEEQLPINVIKIDTEGGEPFIILGAKEIISQQRPTLFLEYWPYGYRHAGADVHAMISFLLQVYKRMYFIDEAKRDVFAVTQEFIDDYCQEMDGYLHC